MKGRMMALVAVGLAVVVLGLIAETRARHVGAAFPGISGKIAFDRQENNVEDIFVFNPDGTGETRLTNNPARDVYATWSPDGTRIAFITSRDDLNPAACVACNYEIYIMDADGTDQTRCTNNPAQDDHPAWSPDGTKITFRSDRDTMGMGTQDLYVMNANCTGTPTRLTTDPADDWYPSWSPNGAKIAFVSRRDGDLDVYTMDPDGMNQVKLLETTTEDRAPDWAPDGSKIAFGGNAGANSDIFTVDYPGGGNLTNLTGPASESAGGPKWSPDGLRVAFTTDRDHGGKNNEIYVMDADGSDQTRLTNNDVFDQHLSWQPVFSVGGVAKPPVLTGRSLPTEGGGIDVLLGVAGGIAGMIGLAFLVRHVRCHGTHS